MAIAIPSSEQDILGIFNSLGSIAGPGGTPAGQPIAIPAAFAPPVQDAAPQPISRPAFQAPQAGGATVGSGQLQAGAAGKDATSLADRVPKFKFAQLQQLGGAGTGVGTTGKGGTNSGAHASKAGAGIAAAAAGVEAGLAASAGGAALGAAFGEGALAAIMLLL